MRSIQSLLQSYSFLSSTKDAKPMGAFIMGWALHRTQNKTLLSVAPWLLAVMLISAFHADYILFRDPKWQASLYCSFTEAITSGKVSHQESANKWMRTLPHRRGTSLGAKLRSEQPRSSASYHVAQPRVAYMPCILEETALSSTPRQRYYRISYD